MIDRDELEQARIRNKASNDQDASRWNRLENESGFEYSRVLVTTATILFPLSFVALGTQIGSKNAFQLLEQRNMIWVLIAWIGLAASLFLGSINLWLDKLHYGKWSDFAISASGIFSKKLSNKLKEAIAQSNDMYESYNHLRKDAPPERRLNILILLQTVSIWISVALLLWLFWSIISIKSEQAL